MGRVCFGRTPSIFLLLVQLRTNLFCQMAISATSDAMVGCQAELIIKAANISRNTESSMVKGWSRSNEMSGQRLLSHSGLVFELLGIRLCRKHII